MADKERKKIIKERVPVRRQSPRERVRNWEEVALGYSADEAKREAQRCLACRKPKCVDGCPVSIDIPGFIAEILDGKFEDALARIRRDNLLPGVCGRVCPQENQCEATCVLGKKGEPVSIGKLERFVADYEAEKEIEMVPEILDKRGFPVAVVGSGPAGLTTAAELARRGHRVTIFESLHVAGGVLTYGIPEFRLPQWVVDREIKILEKMGVEIVCDFVVGRTATVEDLLKEFRSIFIGIGAGLPVFMGIPGENLNGVYSANEFLTRCNLMRAREFPEYDTPVKRTGNFVVVGGGNVAMDAARTALRIGAENVHIVYRRSRKEMPARIEEVEHGEEEGVIFHLLTNPVEVIGRDGWCHEMKCQKMELGEPDESGRRRPIPVPGEYVTIPADVLVMAIGTRANPLLPMNTPGLELTDRGYIKTDKQTGETSIPGVYAGGDIVNGSATVIEAMGAGKRSAEAMDRRLKDIAD